MYLPGQAAAPFVAKARETRTRKWKRSDEDQEAEAKRRGPGSGSEAELVLSQLSELEFRYPVDVSYHLPYSIVAKARGTRAYESDPEAKQT